MGAASFPEAGILWHEWNEETVKRIQERGHPVLVFVANPDPTVAPFLKAFLQAAPKNERLRTLLHEYAVALLFKAGEVAWEFAAFGLGERYNIGIFSPGLNPIATIDPSRQNIEELVEVVAECLTRLKADYP